MDVRKKRADRFVSNPISEGIGPVKALATIIQQKSITTNQCMFGAQANKSRKTRNNLRNQRSVNPVSNPNSKGNAPVKAF
jgi:hypothetical protein